MKRMTFNGSQTPKAYDMFTLQATNYNDYAIKKGRQLKITAKARYWPFSLLSFSSNNTRFQYPVVAL